MRGAVHGNPRRAFAEHRKLFSSLIPVLTQFPTRQQLKKHKTRYEDNLEKATPTMQVSVLASSPSLNVDYPKLFARPSLSHQVEIYLLLSTLKTLATPVSGEAKGRGENVLQPRKYVLALST